MGVDNSSLLDQQVASGVGNLLTRSVMYQILSACFLYPEEKNLSILKSPDFQEHVKDLMLCYEGNDDGVELKRCLKEVQELFKGTTIETLQRVYQCIVGHTMSKECPLYETNMALLTCISKCMSWVIFKAFIRLLAWISLM